MEEKLKRISDYKCPEQKEELVTLDCYQKNGIKFPEVHKNRDMIVKYAKLIKNKNGHPYVDLPFCHTLEADSMGGDINYGNEMTGPRAGKYLFQELNELLTLPMIDTKKGRAKIFLDAVRELKSRGEFVVFEVAGPFTILNVLIDPSIVFKGMRREKDTIVKIFNRFIGILANYIKDLEEAGVDAISFADPTGGVNILGPKFAELYIELFTYDFLRYFEKIDSNLLFILCPKTTLALVGVGKAEFVDIKLDREMSYGETFIHLKGKNKFLGHMCIGKANNKLMETKAIRLI